MRHIKLVVILAVLVIGGAWFMRAKADNPSVRGQDPNIETRGTNTAGLPIAGTSGATDPTADSTTGHDGRTGSRAEGGAWQGDGGWLAEAAHMNAIEAALAELAERRATSADVKHYASGIHSEHRAAADELKQLASRRGWAFPQSLDALHKQTLQALDRTQEAAFDRAYVDAMIASHEKALASHRVAAARAADSELKAFAAKQIPILQRHLEHARALR